MAPSRARRMRRVGGTPIEEAPAWALALLWLVLWLVLFPALVGLLNGMELKAGGGWMVAAAAAAISALLVVGLACQRPWERPTPEEPYREVPLFARFATWLWVTLIVPNVLFGLVVLLRGGEGLDYFSAWMIGGLVSATHGGAALLQRRRTGTSSG